MSSDSFSYIFSKRAAICFFIIISLFFSCMLRVAVTATSDYSEVQKQQSSLRLTAGGLRGTIYDCNMAPFTNSNKKIIAAVSPTPRAVTAISAVLSGEELQNVLERLKDGKPVLCEVPREIDCDGISCTEVYEHNSADTKALHIVGYTDADSHGVSGLERAYDKYLYSDKSLSFVYTTDGRGNVLEGIKPKIENDTSVTAAGVVSTLDINIQTVAEEAASRIECGAIVIADAKTSKIRAMVSVPEFDVTNISDYLETESSPLLNRALAAYNVGSVFKPCVAAAGIEAGKSGFCYECTGSTKIIDRYFKCHKLSGHGYMNLKSGLANSCNTYFYNFAFEVGGERIYNTASALGFGKSLAICDGISSVKGSLPSLSSLSNIASLANFSIGQGELLVSPVSMLNLYCAIASDGSYAVPSVVEGTLSEGSFTPYDTGSRTRVMSEKTAALLRDYLSAVIEEGTGKSAKPETVSAAGKTATAQTGKFENGTEICEGWFCGFFPADDPVYTVVIFSENIREQSATCGELFAEIADRLYSMKIKEDVQ
ncbi:MAG: peptidoglycan D,D-transpeptidase FtsI family protein [Acutalibacteraceae bacterium]